MAAPKVPSDAEGERRVTDVAQSDAEGERPVTDVPIVAQSDAEGERASIRPKPRLDLILLARGREASRGMTESIVPTERA